jgi:hypothetical protein
MSYAPYTYTIYRTTYSDTEILMSSSHKGSLINIIDIQPELRDGTRMVQFRLSRYQNVLKGDERIKDITTEEWYQEAKSNGR